MDDEEHEVYGQEIPVHGDMDSADVGMGTAGDDAAELQELAALRDMQVKVAKKMQGQICGINKPCHFACEGESVQSGVPQELSDMNPLYVTSF